MNCHIDAYMTIILRIKCREIKYSEELMKYLENNLILKVNHEEVIINGEHYNGV